VILEAARIYVDVFETITGESFVVAAARHSDSRPHPRQPRAVL